jgi:hypothetical protein
MIYPFSAGTLTSVRTIETFVKILCHRFFSFAFLYGVSDIFMSAFQMELNDYSHFDLTEDGTMCSTGQHCLRFPRVLYDALIRLGYTTHETDQCEVSVMIPFDPMELWSRSVIGSEPDTDVELMAHITLTSLCEDHLATTAALPIALLLI